MAGACRTHGIINAFKISATKPEGRKYLGDLGVDGRITLKWILKKRSVRVWIGFIWLRIAPEVELL
jgi:hypothetical protein